MKCKGVNVKNLMCSFYGAHLSPKCMRHFTQNNGKLNVKPNVAAAVAKGQDKFCILFNTAQSFVSFLEI